MSSTADVTEANIYRINEPTSYYLPKMKDNV